MDATIVIATILILGIALFVVLIKHSVKANEQKTFRDLTNKVSEVEKKYNKTITLKDFFRLSVIGMDNDRTFVLYINDVEDKGVLSFQITLEDVTNAKVWYRSLTKGFTTQQTNKWDLQEVILRLSLHEGKQFDICFYSEVMDGPAVRNIRIELAKKWENLINSSLQ